jgi:hypothetical protein
MRVGTRFLAVALLSLAFAGTAHGWELRYANGPDPATSRWPSWPYPAGCLGTTFDPVAVFGGRTEAELGQGGPEQALKRYLDEGLYPQVPTKYWRLVSSTETRASFASGRLEQGLFWLSFELVDGQWRLAGDLGECKARTVRDGNAAIDWGLPGGQSLSGKSRRIEVKLHASRGCDGGRSLNKAAEPEFRRAGKRLLLTIWVTPLPPGNYTCEKLIEPPLVLKLPGRLGDRELWDGGTYPPDKER